MIPQYPNFIRLTLDIKQHFDELTSLYEPYAEFSFACPFFWDTENTASVSTIDSNLIIKMPDYHTMEPFFSIIGTKNMDTALVTILRDTKKLELVPEATILSLKRPERFKISEDRNQHDYVYSTFDQAHLPGGHFKGRRNKNVLFYKQHNEYLDIRRLNLTNDSAKKDVMDVFESWAAAKERDKSDTKHERDAMHKLLDTAHNFDLLCIGLYLGNKCVGFSINELVQLSFAVCRFQKTSYEYNHTDVFLTNIVAREVRYRGFNFISWEQDLGVPGLRAFKESYNPVKYLKKFSVELAD